VAGVPRRRRQRPAVENVYLYGYTSQGRGQGAIYRDKTR
jgi:hypothetical protein